MVSFCFRDEVVSDTEAFRCIVVPHIEISATVEHAGLLLSEVGESILRLPPKQSLLSHVAALDAMRELHRIGVSHGDARLENIVQVRFAGDTEVAKCKWIDLFAADPMMQCVMERPAETADLAPLVRSKPDARRFYYDWRSLLASIGRRYKMEEEEARSTFHAMVIAHMSGVLSFNDFSKQVMQVLCSV